jgi:hypothetical protein
VWPFGGAGGLAHLRERFARDIAKRRYSEHFRSTGSIHAFMGIDSD